MVQLLYSTKEGKLNVPPNTERTKCMGYAFATENLPMSGRDFQKGSLVEESWTLTWRIEGGHLEEPAVRME